MFDIVKDFTIPSKESLSTDKYPSEGDIYMNYFESKAYKHYVKWSDRKKKPTIPQTPKEAYINSYSKHKDKLTKDRKEARDKVMLLMGNRCLHCGFADYRALQIDHKKGDGYQCRHSKGSNVSTLSQYRKIIADPTLIQTLDIQLLCANCNWIKRVENGEEGYRKAA